MVSLALRDARCLSFLPSNMGVVAVPPHSRAGNALQVAQARAQRWCRLPSLSCGSWQWFVFTSFRPVLGSLAE